MKNQSIFYFT